jgi:hypothetical protein
LEIVGVWSERQQLEQSLKRRLRELAGEKDRLRDENRRMRQSLKRAERAGFVRGAAKERRRADRMARSIQDKSEQIQILSRKVKDLQDQLKRGTTPQMEGLNYERDLVKDLRKHFPQDRIEHYGKSGDILHCVIARGKEIGQIIIECKITSRFSRAYVVQTKRALAERNATHGVLVTLAAKPGTAGFWVEDDILVVHPFGAVHVVSVLRDHLVSLHENRVGRRESDRRAAVLLAYVKGDEFKNLVGDTIFRTVELYELLKKESRHHRTLWKQRFTHYREIHEHSTRLKAQTAGILHGESVKRIDVSSRRKLLPIATM